MAKAPHSLFAGIYDLFMVPNDRFGLRHQRARLCGEASGKVLEIAVGTGLNLSHYEAAEVVVGIDNHRGMLKRAIRRTWESSVPTELVAADANRLPFPTATFDSVVVGFSLCTIPDTDVTLREMARVTKPDGSLHFLEHVRSEHPRTAGWQDRFSKPWQRVSGGCRPNQDTVAIVEQSPWQISTIWRSDTGGLVQGTATL